MIRTIAAACIGLTVAAATASAACAPSDIVGKWYINAKTAFPIYSAGPSTIDTRGNWIGGVNIQDGLKLLWDIRSITPIKVDTNCVVTGQFGLFYGGPPAVQSFAFRAFMAADKNYIGKWAIVYPGYDNLPVGQREIEIELIRFRP